MNDLTLARQAARAGAEIVGSWADRLESAEFKGIGNPVTEADRESEQAIMSLIAQHRPDDGIVGEEGASTKGTSGRRWLVDPLDGTVNFLHGFPHVSVSVAVEDDLGGIAGVVRDVFRDEEFAASRGGGAEFDGEPMHVAGRTDLANALIATGFSYDRQERGAEYGRVLGEMLGVVSITDILREGGAAEGDAEDELPHEYYLQALESRFDQDDLAALHLEVAPEVTAKDIMTPMVFEVGEGDSIQAVADTMIKGHIHRVFVTHGKEIVGVITAMDMLNVIRDM